MKSNDYVKFLTQTVMEHIDTPKEERLKRKTEKKQMQEPLSYKYFGIMPLAVKEGMKMVKNRKKSK